MKVCTFHKSIICTLFAIMLAVTLFIFHAHAGEAASMNLAVEDAVMRSLQNNEAFLLQKMQPKIIGAFEAMERGEYDPILFAELAYSRQNTTEVSRSTGDQFDVEVQNRAGVVGIEQKVPTGTQVDVTVSATREDSSRTPVQYGSRLGISITQQLLRGMRPAVNLARIRKAEMDTRISEFELSGYAEILVAEVEVAYWQYVHASLAISVVEKSLEVAEAELHDVKEGIAVGAVPENDVAQASAEVGFRKQRLVEAKQARQRQKLHLLQLIDPNMRMSLQIEIIPQSSFSSSVFSKPNVDDSVQLALESRMEIKEASLRLSKGDLDVAVTKNGVLPRLELFVDLGKTGYASSFGESFSNLDSATYDAEFGLRFSHVLGNRTARAKRQAATATMAMQQQSIENLRTVITYDVFQAYNDWINAEQLLDITMQTAAHSRAALESIQIKFDAGAATRLEVVQAERDLLESEIESLNAQVKYQISKVRMYQAEGSLLTRRGIQLD